MELIRHAFLKDDPGGQSAGRDELPMRIEPRAIGL